MKDFLEKHTHSLMSAAIFSLLVALNVAHLSSPSVDGIAALLMAGMHLDGIAAKYLAANTSRAETISHLAKAIFAGLEAWNNSKLVDPPSAPSPEGPITKRDIKAASAVTPTS